MIMKKFVRIACCISGGVDSSVAAFLLLRKGFDVIGVFMRNWDQLEEGHGTCSADKDFEDGYQVCKKLGIKLVEVNFVKEYWNFVFSELLKEYSDGLSPNPDVLCNRYIKFDALYSHCTNRLGADAIASGHYARTSFGPYLEQYKEGNVMLLHAKDRSHDQTFFLSQVPQQGLRHCMFPLGEYTKKEVRQMATEARLLNVAEKKASVGICHVGERNFKTFISEYLHDRPGNFVDSESGKVVGQHRGIHLWTIGQRCKIRSTGQPFFVANKNFTTGDITVVQGHDHPLLYSTSFETEQSYWIQGSPPSALMHAGVFKCEFRFQQADPLVRCRIQSTASDRLLRVSLLDGPARALTPGQYAVFYDGEVCLGSAKIMRVS